MKPFFLIGLLFLACSGPSSIAVGLKPLKTTDVIVAFGDSLTVGVGADPLASYPAMLQKQINRKVIGSGVSGETTAKGLKRLPQVLDQHKPSLLIVCEGGNDFLRSVSEKSVKNNLREMIEIAKEKGIDVVLIAVPKSESQLTPPPLYEELGKEFGLPVETGSLKKIGGDPTLVSDPIHPNDHGYRLMTEAVAALLKKYGGL